MLITMFILCLLTSFIFFQMNHPLAMGLMLLMQTLLNCITLGLFMKTFWFSYILFLVFLGGMLVLFIYVTSLSSNEMFSISFKLIFISLMTIISTMFMLLFFDKSMIEFFFENNDMNLLSSFSFMQENTYSLNKLYNFPTNLITILLINYLFLTLLVTVKITKKKFGPLRPMN
uniref:NADH-ubiquinone oxidoreductase chain 6 n=1 Tax=Mansonia uniformis TaxID=308735 RepID=A0A7T0CPM1_9DIPT|nr:NADH dehydrogenase subunit 6 [Mansonia uniformis]